MTTLAWTDHPKPIRVHDHHGRCWTVPIRPITRLDAEVAERWFVNVALPAASFRTLVPAQFLAPDLRCGMVVLSLCRIRMRHAAPNWAPLALGPASDNCALRVGCIDVRDGSPAVWIDRRMTTHVLGRILARLGFPPVETGLRIVNDRHGALALRSRDGSLACRVELGHPARPRLFADAGELTSWVTAGVRSYARAAGNGCYQVVDLEKGSPNVFVQRTDRIARLATPWGRWDADGVYRTVDGAYQWRVLGTVDAHGQALPINH